MLRKSRPGIQGPPGRSLIPATDAKQISLLMQEYAAVWAEIHTSLASQVSVLSFGAATLGLLVAAAAQLWAVESLIAGLGLLLAGPAACFLALAVYLGEQVRLTRAGLFLFRLEEDVNRSAGQSPHAAPAGKGDDAPVLTWEHWTSIHEKGRDIDRYNRRAILLVFALLAFGSAAAGYVRLHTAPGLNELWATTALSVGGVLAILSLLWLRYLAVCSNAYRDQYVGRQP